MKNLFLIGLVCVLRFNTNAQAPAIEWAKCFGSTANEYAYDIQQTTDGGFIVLGSTYDGSNGDVVGSLGGDDVWVLKISSVGALEWQKCLGGTEADVASSIKQTSDGGYIVTGSTVSSEIPGYHGANDGYIAKLAANGTIEWQKSIGGTQPDFIQSVQQTSDGGYVLAGYTNSNDGDFVGGQPIAAFIMKLNGSGAITWTHVDDMLTAPGGSVANYVEQTSDGGYIVAGQDRSATSKNYWISKFTSNGAIEWAVNFDNNFGNNATEVHQTAAGGYIVGGYTNGTSGVITGSHGSYEYWILKLDNSGILEWQKSIGGSGWDEGYSVKQTSDGGYIVAGETGSDDGNISGNHSGPSERDYGIFKLDDSGNIQWQKCLGGSETDEARVILQTADNGYVVVGHTETGSYSSSNVGIYNGDVEGNHMSGSRTYDIWVVKLEGSETTTGVSSFSENEFAFEVYPNPTKDIVTIKKLPIGSTVKITDAIGKVVYKSVPKTESMTINTSDFFNGVYTIQVECKGMAANKKLVVSK